jgi:hypothetical protein
VPKLTQHVLVSIDLEPDAHEVVLTVGDELELDGRDVLDPASQQRIGVLPEGLSVDDSYFKPVVAGLGPIVELAGLTYPMVRIELVRR